MRTVRFDPTPEHVMDIVYKHMPALLEFVKEMDKAGYSPSHHHYGDSSNSFTLMVGSVPLTFGKAECSEAIKIKLARLEYLEKKIGELNV